MSEAILYALSTPANCGFSSIAAEDAIHRIHTLPKLPVLTEIPALQSQESPGADHQDRRFRFVSGFMHIALPHGSLQRQIELMPEMPADLPSPQRS